MGGVCESLLKSVKTALEALVKDRIAFCSSCYKNVLEMINSYVFTHLLNSQNMDIPVM